MGSLILTVPAKNSGRVLISVYKLTALLPLTLLCLPMLELLLFLVAVSLYLPLQSSNCIDMPCFDNFYIPLSFLTVGIFSIIFHSAIRGADFSYASVPWELLGEYRLDLTICYRFTDGFYNLFHWHFNLTQFLRFVCHKEQLWCRTFPNMFCSEQWGNELICHCCNSLICLCVSFIPWSPPGLTDSLTVPLLPLLCFWYVWKRSMYLFISISVQLFSTILNEKSLSDNEYVLPCK